MGLFTETMMDAISESIRASGEAAPTTYKSGLHASRKAAVEAYHLIVRRVEDQLPAVLVALDVAIKDLRRELERAQ